MPIAPAADATADAGVDSLGEGPECVVPRDCSTVDTTMAFLAVPWAICTAGLLAVVLYVNVHIFSIHAAVSAAVTSENSAVADSAAPPSSSLLLPSTRDRDRARYTVLSLSIAAVLAHVVLSYLLFRRAYYLLLDVSLSLLDLSAMVEMVRKMHCAAFFFVDSVERACAMEPCRTFWVKTFSPCAEVSAAESALNTLSLQQLKLDARFAAAAADAAAHVVEEVDGGSRSSDTLTASTITASTDVTSSSSSRPPTAFARSEEQERQWQPRGTMATDATVPPPPPPLPAAAAAAAARATASVAEAEGGARRCSGTAGSPDRQLLPPPQEEAEEDGSLASLMNVSRRPRQPFSLEVRRRHVALLQISFLTYGELVQGHSLALPQLATRFISAVLLAARRFEAHVVDLREDGATLAWNAFSVSRGDYVATCAQCGHWLSGSYFRPMSADSEARFAVAGFAGFAVCGTTSERGGHVLHGQPVTVMRELPALLERRYCPFVWLATASSAAAAVGGATPPALRDGPAWVRWGTVKAGDGHSFGLFALDDGDGDDLGVLRRGGGGAQPWVWHAPEWKMFGDEADLELPSDPSLAVALRDGAGGPADPHDLRSPPPLPTTATTDTAAAAASQALLSEEPVVSAALPAAEQPVPRRAASASEAVAAAAPAPSPAPSLPPVETFHDSKGKLYQLSHNILGESKACVVRLALSDSGTLVAVKEIKIQRGDVSSMRQRRCRREKRILVSAGDPSPLLGEVRIMERLYHTCIVGYIACQESATALRIIMEYVGGGTLLQFASVAGEKGRRGPAVRFPVAVLLRSVLEGIAFLHRHGILHGDIKPQNVLVPDSGPCKIADFGISRRLANPAAPSVEGTPFYMAPEVTRGAASMASDVWSFGILFAEVLTGRLPYDPDISDTYLVTQFMFGRDVERRTCVPLESDANDVFLSCTHYDAAQRKTAAELLCMPYFSLEGSEGYG